VPLGHEAVEICRQLAIDHFRHARHSTFSLTA
jgi:hypothetical protein